MFLEIGFFCCVAMLVSFLKDMHLHVKKIHLHWYLHICTWCDIYVRIVDGILLCLRLGIGYRMCVYVVESMNATKTKTVAMTSGM